MKVWELNIIFPLIIKIKCTWSGGVPQAVKAP
jgi:hypothetical protein